MKIKKILIISLSLYFFLISCGTFEEAGRVLRNEKIKSTDEFLVEKKLTNLQPMVPLLESVVQANRSFN